MRVSLAAFGVAVWVAAGCTTAPAPSNTSPTSSVVVESVQASPPVYRGPCPATITFSARISVVGGPAVISYRFIRSDNAQGPVRTLTFRGPDSADVRDTWQLGLPGFRYSGWEAVTIVSPPPVSDSMRANFTISCS